jgi:hypothetical protein
VEQNYQIFDRELLTVIRMLTEWHHYLEGNPHPVIVFTDHKNLLYFRTAQKLTSHQAHWQLILSMFNIELHHIPGTKLAAPDALSHRPDHHPVDSDNADVTLLPDTMFVHLLDKSLHDALSMDDPSSDPIFSTASDALNSLCLPPMKSALSDWKIVNGILYYKDRTYVSPATHLGLLCCLHDHPTAGHPSHFKMEELVERDYWWPGLGAYVRKYVEGCSLCQQMKADTHPVTPPLVPISSDVTVPFTSLSVDLITDLPPSGGFDSIMVVVNHGLMKGVIITPCLKTITLEGVAKLFFKHVYHRFGLYDKIISDRGPQFISKFSKALAKLLDYTIAPSTAYHLQTDGQTKHLNQELETYLRIYCQTNPETWVEHLPLTEFVHNHRKHDSRNALPFYLMMGYNPRSLPHTLALSSVPAAEERVRLLQKA